VVRRDAHHRDDRQPTSVDISVHNNLFELTSTDQTQKQQFKIYIRLSRLLHQLGSDVAQQ